jgi:hypothetical protein
MSVQELVGDPVGFIKKNLLVLHGDINDPPQAAFQPNGTVRLALQQLPGGPEGYGSLTRARNRKGLAKLFNHITGMKQYKAMNYYRVVLAGPGTAPNEQFSAYICPYRQNEAPNVVLRGDANLMFTAEMTGCSFGIGMPNANGDRRVMHSNEANQATQNSTAPQEAAQLRDMQRGLGRGHALQPKHYRVVSDDSDQRATTIGVRVGGAWQFWFQHYNFLGNDGTTMLRVRQIC